MKKMATLYMVNGTIAFDIWFGGPKECRIDAFFGAIVKQVYPTQIKSDALFSLLAKDVIDILNTVEQDCVQSQVISNG